MILNVSVRVCARGLADSCQPSDSILPQLHQRPAEKFTRIRRLTTNQMSRRWHSWAFSSIFLRKLEQFWKNSWENTLISVPGVLPSFRLESSCRCRAVKSVCSEAPRCLWSDWQLSLMPSVPPGLSLFLWELSNPCNSSSLFPSVITASPWLLRERGPEHVSVFVHKDSWNSIRGGVVPGLPSPDSNSSYHLWDTVTDLFLRMRPSCFSVYVLESLIGSRWCLKMIGAS